MTRHYGDTADIESAAKADALLVEGQREEQRAWMRIAKAEYRGFLKDKAIQHAQTELALYKRQLAGH